jgi:hypothetical protein
MSNKWLLLTNPGAAQSVAGAPLCLLPGFAAEPHVRPGSSGSLAVGKAGSARRRPRPVEHLVGPPCFVWVAYLARLAAAGGTHLRVREEAKGGEGQRPQERKHDEQVIDGSVVYRAGAYGER